MDIDATKANLEYETTNSNLIKSLDESKSIQSEKNNIQIKVKCNLKRILSSLEFS